MPNERARKRPWPKIARLRLQMSEYTAFRSASSRESPVTDVPIRLVTQP
jgi:hypothetical protein